MLGDVNKLFVSKSLLTTPSNVLLLHLKQTFPQIIWIFNEGDGIKSRLPVKKFSALWKKKNLNLSFFFFFLAKENVNKLVFDPNDMSITDKLGMHFEIAMTNFFTDLGTLFARYPLPVIVLSVGFAVGLSTGIKWLNVTTDPIELWASPSSRSRIEKDFFDKTFRPFYRTEQIIITAKNLSSVSF